MYHTALDNYDTFSRDSARQYLDDTTAMALYFATTTDLDLESHEDGVFFALPFAKLVVVPERVAKAVSFLLALLSMIFIAVGIIKKQARLSRVVVSAIGFIACLGLSSAIVFGLQEMIHAIFFSQGGSMWGNQWSTPVFIVMSLLVCAGGFLLARKEKKGFTPYENALGALLVPAALCVALPFVFPGGLYLGGVITVTTLLYLVAVKLLKRRLLVPLVLFGVVTMAVIAPIGYLLFTALGFYASNLAIPLLLLPVMALGALDGYGITQKGQPEMVLANP